jgi:DNA-binding MarR family transcriptional regulator
VQARLMSALRDDCGYRGLRPSFTPLLARIWREDRPLTALAGELAISAQACSQLVSLVEAAGYLERRPNPEDGRSRVVRLTPRGRALVEDSLRILAECDAEYAELVGAAAYQRFTAALAVLYRELGIPVHADAALTAQAGRSIGVLPVIAARIAQELMDAAIARGHDALKMSHAELIPQIGPEGARIGEIARQLGVSRQAIHATARELEAQGYLRRELDPRDRRGSVLALSARGAELIGDSVAAIEALEVSFRALLGAQRFAHVERVARDLHHSLAAHGTTHDIEGLAARLRRQLGPSESARLAALLEPRFGTGG